MTAHYHCLDELDVLLAGLTAGRSRREQLGMVRAELARGLELGELPLSGEASLARLLADDSLRGYVRLARTGALRSRLVGGGRPPTAEATNAARLSCLDQIRNAAGMPPLDWADGEPVPARATPGADQLASLRRHLGQCLQERSASAGQIRFYTLVCLVLDTGARSGELVSQRTTDLDLHRRALRMARRPQHGTTTPPEAETVRLSTLSIEALNRWLPVREHLIAQSHGTTRLWVSLRPNHAGEPDTTPRPAGMPLEERGLIRSYNHGRHHNDLTHLLPPKLEQLRRAVTEHTTPSPR